MAERSTLNGKSQVEDVKLCIPEYKVYEFGAKNNFIKQNIQILKILNFENFLKDKFRFNDFPNLFVIVIIFPKDQINNNKSAKRIKHSKLPRNQETDYESVKNVIHDKFPESRPILLQVRKGNENAFYMRQNQLLVEIDLKVKLEKPDLLNVDVLLSVIKCPIFDANFNSIKKYFECHNIYDHKIHHSAINSKDGLCLRILNLFDIKFSEEIQHETLHLIVQSKCFDLFLAHFNVFDQDHIIDTQDAVLFLSSKKIFELSIERNNTNVLRFLLKFNTYFQSVLTVNFFENILCEFSKIDTEVYKILLDFDYQFFNDTKTISGQQLLNKISQLQCSISNGNFSDVETFTEKFPELRLCYGGLIKVGALEYSITKFIR